MECKGLSWMQGLTHAMQGLAHGVLGSGPEE